MNRQTRSAWPAGLELGLIRHGHINWGQHGAGDVDYPLDDLGERQAIALGESWRGTKQPDAVLRSPLKRAGTTMVLSCTAAGWNLDEMAVIIVPEFAEQRYGLLGGLTDEQINQRFPEEAKKKAQQGWWFYQPPGGQNWQQVERQQHPAFRRLQAEFASKTIKAKLFGHCVQIQCSRKIMEGMTPRKLLSIDLNLVTNCSETLYRCQEGKMVLVGEPYYRPESVARLK